MVPVGRETQHLPVEYSGPGEAFVRTVANLAYGGQVVLTERAWVSVQDKIPGQAQVLARFPGAPALGPLPIRHQQLVSFTHESRLNPPLITNDPRRSTATQRIFREKERSV